MKVEAIQSMHHNGHRARGDQFVVSPQHADQLIAKGLAKVVRPTVATPARSTAAVVPPPAVGIPSSASPAAPASPQTTRRRSAAGVRRTPQAEPSSS